MENYVKKWVRRLLISLNLAIVGVLCFTLAVLAAPGLVTDFTGITTDNTTINLLWTPADDSTTTVIRYSDVNYPTSPAFGTSAYSGAGFYTTVSDLTAGTTYYFSAWGYDGGDYSATALSLAVTTLPAVTENTTMPFASPVLPADTWQDPDSSGWSIHPIDDILEYFADPTTPPAHGGLGIETDNLIMFITGVIVTGLGLVSYVKWRSFFSSWFIVLILSGFCCTIEVMQWIVVIFLLLVGAGVWAIENSTQ